MFIPIASPLKHATRMNALRPATATLTGSRRLRPTQRTQVTEALRAFSIEAVIAYTAAHEPSKAVAQGLEKCTNYLAPVALDVD